MPRIRIDNHEIDAEAGTTILQAARKIGLDIPALCFREGCSANTSCLACVVKVNHGHRLLPSCATKVAEGMIVESETEEIHEARKTALELLLADHAGDCFAPCTNVCPAHMDIPLMIRHIQDGDLHEALVTVKEMIALPAILGRICPELCEAGCRRKSMDSPVAICRLKRHVADVDLATGKPYVPPCSESSGKRVAIVGTGPAGLAAAYYLLQHGHQPVLFDDHPEPGGNLRYAVDREKLPIDVLDGEIGIIRSMGAQFRQNVRVGNDVSIAELQKEFDAVLMTVGELDKAKAAALGLDMLGKGLKTDKDSMMTPLPGVFAAGAAVTPYRHAIRAVADGREAAVIIDQYLRGLKIIGEGQRFTVRLGVLNESELSAFTLGASPNSRAAAPVNHQGFSIPAAHDEAMRCLHCDCGKLDACLLREYSAKYGANPKRFGMDRRPFERIVTHADVVYEPGKCIQCGLCVQITERSREPLGLTFIGRGFALRIGVPFNREMSEALRKVGEECVKACPTGALVMRGDIRLDQRKADSADKA